MTSTPLDATRYFAAGYHAFIACDTAECRDRVAALIENEVSDNPVHVIDCTLSESLNDFANNVVHACEELLAAIGAPKPKRADMLVSWLSHVQACFREADCQGYLVVNHIDEVIWAQQNMQIEGPFREVMQFHNDVAIGWIGSRSAIIDIHQDDRPFYLSHRIFWL